MATGSAPTIPVQRSYDGGSVSRTLALIATTINSHAGVINGPTASVIPPKADPHVTGQVWNNNGTLTISNG